MKSLFLSAVCLLLINSLHAQIYKGTIGKFPIWLNLEYTDANGEIYGTYFYQSQGLDIPFLGTMKGNQLTFRAGSRFLEDKDLELFKLLKKGKNLSGEWLYKGKKLKVLLTVTDPLKTTHPYATNPAFKELKLTGIEHIRTSLAQFQALDSATTLKNGVVLQWYKEKHWESVLFRVAKGLPDATMKWLNYQLEAVQIASFSNFGSCGMRGDDGDGWNTSLTDYFINSDFCSLEIFDDYYCGGAHPDFSSQEFNFDLQHLKKLETEDLLQFPGVVRQNELNFDEWAEYRTVYAEHILSYLRELYPEEFPDIDEESAAAEEICDYGSADVWQFSGLRITPQGFKVGAYFYRAARSCDDPEWSYIPFETVAEFLNPEYGKALLSIGK
jgi:hypothetical protein